MNPADIAPPSAPIPEPRLPAKDETKKLSFWISQLFILLATVLGVYLASSQGFRQAMAYGDLQATRNNYYLRKSLQSEIVDNLQHVRDYMQRLETGGLPARKAPFSLDTFVWESMKTSTSTMETPPDLLRESRRLYRGVADLQQKIADNTYSAKTGTDKLKELVDHMETDVLPRFDADLAALRKKLQDNGVVVE